MKDFDSVQKTVEGNEGSKCNYPTRLDTYGCGCQHDCSYCYAKSLLDFRKLWNPTQPSVGNISKIAKEVRKLPKDQIVRLGGMTDCFQPCEKTYRITYKTIKLLNKRRIPYLIVTKSSIIADDEYIELLDKDLAHIQVTVTTLDIEKNQFGNIYEIVFKSEDEAKIDKIQKLWEEMENEEQGNTDSGDLGEKAGKQGSKTDRKDQD